MGGSDGSSSLKDCSDVWAVNLPFGCFAGFVLVQPLLRVGGCIPSTYALRAEKSGEAEAANRKKPDVQIKWHRQTPTVSLVRLAPLGLG